MKDVKKIIVHCSATREGDDSINAEVIDRWHKKRGWKGIGYHFVVLIDGSIETGRMINKCGAHTKGMNCKSIGVCYIGGVESERNDKGKYSAKDTRTPEQIATLLELLRLLKKIYPDAKIHGHRDFAAKACPSFDATDEYKNI
jgi:N-acetylmuramoyl-L-alanine amidase|tara:strand:+ start:416 stop:844 length:429 start_codon:yes stop_codon:yes gene_type:complete